MSVRSFHSLFMVGGVAAAALGCYLVSLRVASERAALESVETEIVLAQRDIRLLQTEIGTRGRLAQLERWNVRVLALSAPTADQFVPDSFQLARLATPETKPALEAPVVYASAPPPPEAQILPGGEDRTGASPRLMHEASLKAAVAAGPAKRASPAKPAESRQKAAPEQSGGKPAATKLAQADPLAPLPEAKKKAARPASPAGPSATAKDSGKTR